MYGVRSSTCCRSCIRLGGEPALDQLHGSVYSARRTKLGRPTWWPILECRAQAHRARGTVFREHTPSSVMLDEDYFGKGVPVAQVGTVVASASKGRPNRDYRAPQGGLLVVPALPTEFLGYNGVLHEVQRGGSGIYWYSPTHNPTNHPILAVSILASAATRWSARISVGSACAHRVNFVNIRTSCFRSSFL